MKLPPLLILDDNFDPGCQISFSAFRDDSGEVEFTLYPGQAGDPEVQISVTGGLNREGAAYLYTWLGDFLAATEPALREGGGQ